MMKKLYKSIPIVLAILAPSIIMRAFAMDILLPCMPNIAEYFQVPFSTSQWLLSIYFIGAGIGQLIVGPLADEYGRRRVLLVSTLIIVLSSYACTQITDINLMLLMRFLQGLGACGTTVVSMAIIRDLYTDQQLARVYSFSQGIVAFAPLFAPVLGGILLTQTGTWRATFYFIAAFSIVALVIDYFLIIETNPRFHANTSFVKVPILKSYWTLIRDVEFLSYCCFDVMGMSSMFMFFSMSSILLINILGISPQVFGYYFAASAIMYLVGNILSPLVQKPLTNNGTIMLGSSIMLLSGIVMYALNKFFGLTALGLIIPNAISTFGVGLMFGPSMAGVVLHYKHIAGIASAAYGAIFLGGSALLVAAIMQLEIVDASVLAIGIAWMGLINIVVVFRLLRRRSKDPR